MSMRSVLRSLGLTALLAALSAPSWAQWPAYPSANVPKTADGKPDLAAAAPRAADGHPDFSGIWQVDVPQGGPPGPNAKPPAPAPGAPPWATFFNIGAGFADGLPFKPWARKLREERMANNDKDNPDAHCLPIGLTQFHMHPQPRKIIQTPQELVMLYESNYGVRQIFTDGRKSPDNDPEPWWYGYSVGRWDGDTLVVTTTHLRDGGWLDVTGSPQTDQATVTERYTRPDFGHMIIDVTIDDPKAYTKPFTVRVRHKILLDTNLIEFICLENEQSSRYYDGD